MLREIVLERAVARLLWDLKNRRKVKMLTVALNRQAMGMKFSASMVLHSLYDEFRKENRANGSSHT